MILTCVFLALALRGGVGGSALQDCAPTNEMRARASVLGYEIASGKHPEANTPMSCGDVNEDGKVDLCTVLVNGPAKWKAACFVSRGGEWKVESIADSSDVGLNAVRPVALSLEVMKAGTTLTWANAAAELTLRRDCVWFGVSESAERLYCFNGATFLPLQLSD